MARDVTDCSYLALSLWLRLYLPKRFWLDSERCVDYWVRFMMASSLHSDGADASKEARNSCNMPSHTERRCSHGLDPVATVGGTQFNMT
jgi:hypothetical protein